MNNVARNFWVFNPTTMVITESYTCSPNTKYVSFTVQNYFWHMIASATVGAIKIDFSCLNDLPNYTFFTAFVSSFVPGDPTSTLTFAPEGISSWGYSLSLNSSMTLIGATATIGSNTFIICGDGKV